MFISFCLHYAGIAEEDFPYDSGTINWADHLAQLEMYHDSYGYIPKSGDVIFFDWEGDHRADHVGIVYQVDEENNSIRTIEGNHTSTVEVFDYSLDLQQIMGYGILPENPDYEPAGENEKTESALSSATEDTADTTGEADAEDKKESDAASEETVPGIPMPEQSFEKNVGGIKVSVEALEGAFPENTTMSVTPVNGNMLKTAVADAVNGEVLEVQAVDIKFYSVEGEEIEPRIPIRVTIVPERSQHDDNTTKVVHIDKSGDAELIDQAEDAEITDREVVFDADSFSIYCVVYTVDFEYSVDGQVYKFSLPGGEKIALSELVGLLGIVDNTDFESAAAFMREISNVEFSDESLVKVTQIEGDWELESLQAFDTEESLTITMKNGDVVVVKVTDDQVSTDMKDAVKSATMNGQSGNDWTVRSDEEYTVHLEFVEVPGSVQFPTTSDTLVYNLPSTFNPHTSVTGIPVVLTYTEKSVSHTLQGCTYDVGTDGKVTIHLTEEARSKLAESGDGTFKLDINGFFTENAETADFGGGNIKNITVNDTKDVSISKSGSYESSDDKVHYTLTVRSQGTNTNINVSDVISGTALTFDQGSISVEPNGTSYTVTNQDTTRPDTGFNMTIDSMSNNETITIRYTASVDWDVIGTGKGTAAQTGNGVTITSREDPDSNTDSTTLENRIDYNPLAKSAGTVASTSNENIKTIPWTITVNEQGLKDMENTVITDEINWNSRSIMKYAGAGISVEKIRVNDDGTKTSLGSTPVSWETLGVDTSSAYSWDYTITDSGKYMYVITYETVVDVTGQNGNSYVANSASDGDHGTGDVGTNVEPGTSKIDVEKNFISANKEEMQWEAYIDVPANGLSKAIFVDSLPSADISGTKYRDALKEGSIVIETLESGESYKLTESSGKFTLTFYQDEDQTVPGLKGTGTERRIKISFTTENSEEWVAVSRTSNHTNNVSFEGDNATVTDQATGSIPQRGIEKASHGSKTITNEAGENVLAFEYTIDLYGITDADFNDGVLTVTDDYDQKYFKFLELRGYDHKYGIDTWFVQILQNGNNGGEIADRSNGTNDPAQISPIEDIANGILTFSINKSQFPTNADGSYYPRYQLRYYLVVKDGDTQKQLLQDSLAENDRTLELVNKAAWGTSESEVTVDYSYPGLVKENVKPSTTNDENTTFDPNTGMTGFKIVINPDAIALNGGNDMTLTDEYTGNLSVDYSSIKITVEPAEGLGEKTVTYDYRGNVGTFIIPDQCKVTIEYDAKVVGTPSEWVNYGNEVKMNGFTDSASGRAQIGGAGDGGFNLYSITLFKYDAGHMERGLNGATFTLVDENGNPVVYPLHATRVYPEGHEKAGQSVAGDPITFTTHTVDGKPGYVDINLNEQEDGISLQKGITYYLKETESPSTHAMNNVTYRFTISDNPNYDNYEYHSGDILKVYDWPVLGKIEVTKSFDGVSSLTEEDQKKIKFEITGTYKDGIRAGQPILLDSWGYAIPAEDLSKYDLSECTEFKVEMTYADFTNGSYALEDLVDGNYVVKETAAELAGFETVTTTYNVDSTGAAEGTQANVTITDNDAHTVAYTNKYENKTADVDITIKKVHKDGSTSYALYGAKFKLEKKNTSGNYETVTSGSVSSDGTFTIPYDNRVSGVTLNSLEAGEYRITEVEAPTNYKIKGDGVFEFTISSDGTISQTSGTSFVDYETADNVFTVDNQEKHSYTITKVDGANVSLKLPGAVFGVYVHTTIAEDKTADKSLPLLTYTTDANGRFEINVEDYDWDTTGTTTYYIQEIQAPAGYSLPDDPGRNYFYFGNRPADVAQTYAANLNSGSRSQTITNDLIELEVQKKWYNLEGQELQNVSQVDDIDSIDFVVYQTARVVNADTGEEISSTEKRYPDADTVYTIDATNNSWNGVTKKLTKVPAIGRDNNGNLIYYTYRVEETVPDGYEVTYTSQNDGRKLIMMNKPESVMVKARKLWSDNTPDNVKVNSGISFKLQRKPKGDTSDNWSDVANSTKSLTIWTGSESVPVHEDWSVDPWTDLSADYEYRVIETFTHNGDRFDVVYSEDEDGTVVVTNNYKSTEISAQKIWSDNTPEDKKLNSDLKFQLQRKSKKDSEADWENYGQVVSLLQWDGSKNVPVEDWTVTWEDLSTDYIYRVQETIKNDYVGLFETPVYSDNQEGVESGKITVTNTYNKTFIDVKKVWKDAESSRNWIKFTLYKVSETYTTPEKVKEGNLDPNDSTFTVHFTDLDKTDDQGKEWKYFVVEGDQSGNGYTTRYSVTPETAISSGTIIVTNEKINETNLAVKKMWLDAEGNPVDPPEGTGSVSVQLVKKVATPKDEGTLVTYTFNQYSSWSYTGTPTKQTVTTKVKPLSSFYIAFKDVNEENIYEVNVDGGMKGDKESKNGYIAYKITVTGNAVSVNVHATTWGTADPLFFELDQELEFGEPQNIGDPVSLNFSNNWAHKWADITPAENERYFIEEISPVEGFTPQYENNDGIRTGIIYVKNVESKPGSLKLTKNVTVDENPLTGSDSAQKKALTDGTYTFNITGPDGSIAVNKTVSIVFENGEAQSATVKNTGSTDDPISLIIINGTVEITDVTPGDYVITETEPTNGMTLSLVSGGKRNGNITDRTITVTVASGKTGEQVVDSGKATFTNNVDSRTITVVKQWKNKDGVVLSVVPAGYKTTVTLYKDGVATGATVTLDGTPDSNGEVRAWVAEFVVPKDGALYTVVEANVNPSNYELIDVSAATNSGSSQYRTIYIPTGSFTVGNYYIIMTASNILCSNVDEVLSSRINNLVINDDGIVTNRYNSRDVWKAEYKNGIILKRGDNFLALKNDNNWKLDVRASSIITYKNGGLSKVGGPYIAFDSGTITKQDTNPGNVRIYKEISVSLDGDNTYTLTNQENTSQPTSTNITIKKVNKDDLDSSSVSTLSGATFVLKKYISSDYQEKDSSWTDITIADSQNSVSGIFSFKGLNTGYYQLVETVCPAGYVKSSADPRFRVKSENGNLVVILVDENGNDIDSDKTDLLKVENDSNGYTVKVGNTPGTELPMTGGPGTTLFTSLGALLASTAGAALILQKKKKTA